MSGTGYSLAPVPESSTVPAESNAFCAPILSYLAARIFRYFALGQLQPERPLSDRQKSLFCPRAHIGRHCKPICQPREEIGTNEQVIIWIDRTHPHGNPGYHFLETGFKDASASWLPFWMLVTSTPSRAVSLPARLGYRSHSAKASRKIPVECIREFCIRLRGCECGII